MEDGRQVKRTRHAPASSASAAGGGFESDEERQRREERERNLRQQITDTEGLLSYMMAFLPINLMVQLAKSIWQHAAPDLSDVPISSATKEERSFWQHVRLAFVTQLAARLTHLTSITLHHPIGFSCWCLDVFVAMVEGHIAGRRAADLTGGTLQTVAIEEGARLTGPAGQSVARTHPPLPAPLDPPPTLHALTTIAVLQNDHRQLADRGWLMPSLAIVQQCGCWWDADRLGQFISSSRSLRRVVYRLNGEDWARVFERIPAAPAGQQGGPLAQLESIGTILLFNNSPAGVERLQQVLVARGCQQSLKQLHVQFCFVFCIDRHSLPILLALDRLVGTCCRQDAPLTFRTTAHCGFDLSIFYNTDFPSHPSPSFKTMLQQLAQQATSVQYTFTQDGLTDPHTDPSPSAIEMASSLAFDKVVWVDVENAIGFHPPADTPPPHPAIISHLKPFPKASELNVWSDLGGAAGQLLAAKMPKQLTKVYIYKVLGAEEVRRVDGAGKGEGVPDDLEDAGSFVHTQLSSVTPHMRGLQCVELGVDTTTAEQHGCIEASLEGTNIDAFSVTRIVISATRVTITAARTA
ncbi:unnamed protein product [Vitrella brassicaformis CCMP3155]|uniref:Uncharacterized protein n=1 Tax=Vitrella brassicaformis (strain CCMP3155) TaxID=1169540 RepID=A0A0G4FJU1_VITBC|nr:unnamed protein product [Vitrella brassicaformis CCMP3155]|eukprot:CEM14031.1 unnamed protein product [Vitrella brassicaformis CCMP3155]